MSYYYCHTDAAFLMAHWWLGHWTLQKFLVQNHFFWTGKNQKWLHVSGWCHLCFRISVGAHWVEVLLGLEWGWGDFLLHTSKYKWTWPTFHFLGAEFVGLIFCLLNDLLFLGWSSAASFSSSPWQKCNHRPTISLSPSLIVYGLENNPLFHPQRGRVGHFLQNSVLFI